MPCREQASGGTVWRYKGRAYPIYTGFGITLFYLTISVY